MSRNVARAIVLAASRALRLTTKQKIGEGSFGKVYGVGNEAIKRMLIYDKNEDGRFDIKTQFITETIIYVKLTRLNSPHIVPLKSITFLNKTLDILARFDVVKETDEYIDDLRNAYYADFTMDRRLKDISAICENTMRYKNKKLDKSKMKEIAIDLELNDKIKKNYMKHLHDLLIGLKHIHDSGVIHGDVKLQNILYNEKKESLEYCDFSNSYCCKEIDGEISTFSSPDFYKFGLTNKSTDVFALGVSMSLFYVDKFYDEFDIVNIFEDFYDDKYDYTEPMKKKKIKFMSRSKNIIKNIENDMIRNILYDLTKANDKERMTTEMILKKYYTVSMNSVDIIHKNVADSTLMLQREFRKKYYKNYTSFQLQNVCYQICMALYSFDQYFQTDYQDLTEIDDDTANSNVIELLCRIINKKLF